MNTHSTLWRRSLATLAAGGLLTLATTLPATAVVLPDPIGNGSSGTPSEVVRFVDDNELEFIQIGLAALGGMALVGAGAAVVRTSRRHHPQPA
jgi:hypothetical protein